MSISDTLLPEFDQETAATRRVIERVPDDDPDWKPHPKSFSIAHLAQLLSWMPGSIGQTLTSSELDLAGGGGYSNEHTATLLEMFDENVRTARETIAASSMPAARQRSLAPSIMSSVSATIGMRTAPAEDFVQVIPGLQSDRSTHG